MLLPSDSINIGSKTPKDYYGLKIEPSTMFGDEFIQRVRPSPDKTGKEGPDVFS